MNKYWWTRKVFHFTLGKYAVSVGSTALRKWLDPHFSRSYEQGIHLVVGIFSLHIQDWTLEVHPLCAACDSPEIGEVGSGDESWTVCGSCRSIEQGYRYVNLREYENA